jgi:hypothetical protein
MLIESTKRKERVMNPTCPSATLLILLTLLTLLTLLILLTLLYKPYYYTKVKMPLSGPTTPTQAPPPLEVTPL